MGPIVRLRRSAITAICLLVAFALAVPSTLNIALPRNPQNLNVVDRSLISWSFQASDFPVYGSNSLARNFYDALAERTGVQPSVRIGGGVSDHTSWNASGTRSKSSYLEDGEGGTDNVTLAPNYFSAISNYYAANTPLTFCLNFNDTTNNFSTAVAEAAAAIEYLGSATASTLDLTVFEIGNEPDFYGSRGWRTGGWNATVLTPQWFDVFDQITAQASFETTSPLTFQAGGFANPPYKVANGFDVVGLLKTKMVDPLITAYSMHAYPQSGCGGLLSLPDLQNHYYVLTNLTQYLPDIAASKSVNATFIIGETNSVSCGGAGGISDTLGAALWMVDYALAAATFDVGRLFFHSTPHSSYSALIPVAYNNVRQQFYPLAYGAYFVANVISSNDSLSIAPLPGANMTDLSGYALYDSTSALQKLVLINMAVYVDTTKARPASEITFATTWAPGASITMLVLQGETTNGRNRVNVSGLTFSSSSGVASTVSPTLLTVDASGDVSFSIEAGSAVLLQLAPITVNATGTGTTTTTTTTASPAATTTHRSAARRLDASGTSCIAMFALIILHCLTIL